MRNLKRAILDRLRSLLPRSRFALNVSVLAGGTGLAQAIILLSSPFLTRLYSPADFGLMAVYASLLSIIGVVTSLRYELAMPLPESDHDAAQVATLCLLILLVNTCLVAVLSLTFGDLIASALQQPALAPFLLLLPVGFFLVGSYEILSYWAIRIKAFPDIARTKLTKAIATVSIQLGGATLGPIALILGQIAGHGAGIIRLARRCHLSSWNHFRGLNWKAIRTTAYRYRDLPLFSSWAALLNMASTAVPLLLIAALFSSGAAGLYAIAQRVLTLPMMLLGQAVSDVFLADAVDAHREGRLGERTLEVHSILVRIGMPIPFVLYFAGELAFGLVFGAAWSEAGQFAGHLSPWMYLVFTAAPVASVIIVLERQRFSAVFNLVMLILRIGTILICALYFDLQPTILAFGLISMLLVLAFLAIMFAFLRIPARRWLLTHLRFLIIGLFCFALPFTLFVLTFGATVWSLVLLATSVALYYAHAYHWLRTRFQ